MQLCLPTTGFTVIVQCFIFIARSFHISLRGCEVINNLGYTVCFFQPVQIPYGIKQVNTLKIRTTLGGGSKLEKDGMLLQLAGWEL